MAEYPEILDAISKEFGEKYIVDGHLDRKALGRLVFANRNKLDRLNEIMHPEICQRMLNLACSCEERYVLFDAPQLFESGLNIHCKLIVGVIADNSVIMKRLLRRDKLTITEAENRLKSQLSKQFFIDNSDYIIYSEYDSYEATKQTSERVLKSIKARDFD